MEQIEFKSDEFISFFCLFHRCVRGDEKTQDTILSTFGTQLDGIRRVREKLMAYPSDLSGFQGEKDKNEHFTILFGHLMEMHTDVFKGKIGNIDQMSRALSNRFGIDSSELLNSYQSYQAFFSQNKDITDKNLNVIKHLYSESSIMSPNLPTDKSMPKTVGAYLESMRHFFDVPTDEKPTVYLHPFPDDPHLSGWATPSGSHQTFCTKRLESDENYVEGTTMLSRRIGTPLHEIAHWMFENSPMRGEFEKMPEQRLPALQQFISAIDKYLKENPETEYHSPCAPMAMHEALASSLGRVMRPETMKNFDYKTDKLYHGFKAGNDLARIVYPIVYEYIATGKKMSDGFFERVVADKEFQKCFCTQKHKSSLRNTLRTLANTQTNTIDLNHLALQKKRNALNR